MSDFTDLYDLRGGVTRVVLYPIGVDLPQFPQYNELDSSAVDVPLDLAGSSYNEQVEVSDGRMLVTHRLSLVTLHGDEIFTAAYLDRVVREGVVADVELTSGASIRLGWSERYGTQYPLRLLRSEFDSGTQDSDIPSKRWVFECADHAAIVD